MKLCTVAGAGAAGLGLLSLPAMCHTCLTLPSKSSQPVHLRRHRVTKASADIFLAMGGFALQYRELWPNRTPRDVSGGVGCFLQETGSAFISSARPALWQRLMLDGRCSEFSLGLSVPLGLTPRTQTDPLKQVTGGIPVLGQLCLAPGREGWMLRLFGKAHQMELVLEGSSSGEEVGK